MSTAVFGTFSSATLRTPHAEVELQEACCDLKNDEQDLRRDTMQTIQVSNLRWSSEKPVEIDASFGREDEVLAKYRLSPLRLPHFRTVR